jgi:hypothetical protein
MQVISHGTHDKDNNDSTADQRKKKERKRSKQAYVSQQQPLSNTLNANVQRMKVSYFATKDFRHFYQKKERELYMEQENKCTTLPLCCFSHFSGHYLVILVDGRSKEVVEKRTTLKGCVVWCVVGCLVVWTCA